MTVVEKSYLFFILVISLVFVEILLVFVEILLVFVEILLVLVDCCDVRLDILLVLVEILLVLVDCCEVRLDIFEVLVLTELVKFVMSVSLLVICACNPALKLLNVIFFVAPLVVSYIINKSFPIGLVKAFSLFISKSIFELLIAIATPAERFV